MSASGREADSPDVRFGSFCDVSSAFVEVRLIPYSGRITRRRLTFTVFAPTSHGSES